MSYKFIKPFTVFVGIFAIATALLGYTSLGSKLSPDKNDPIVEEMVIICERAQIQYLKPDYFGGSNRSFANINFKHLGYNALESDERIHIHGYDVHFSFVSEERFQLRAVGESDMFVTDTLSYEDRIKVKRLRL